MAENSPPPKRFPGPDPLDGIGVDADPDLLDTKYVEVYRHLFEGDQTNTAQAYMALASKMFGVLRDNDNPDAAEPVVVPFWAAQAITKGFMIYRNSILEGRDLRFGAAMGLEGQGKGSKPRLIKETRRVRDWKIGLAVALRIEAGKKPSLAVSAIADEFLVSTSTVWRIWSKHKDFVQSRLDEFRTLST